MTDEQQDQVSVSREPLTMTAQRLADLRVILSMKNPYAAELWNEYDALLDSSEQTIRKLQADKERLDHLQLLIDPAQQQESGGFTQTLIVSGSTTTLRQGIDLDRAARSRPESGEASSPQTQRDAEETGEEKS